MSTPIDLAVLLVAALAAALAAVIDCRTLRIPNRLTFPLVSLGIVFLVFRCALGYPLMWAAVLPAVSYAFVYGLWKSRLWGGGDAKLVLALFILISPVYPPFVFIAAFSIGLAIVLLMKRAILRQRHAHPCPMSAEGIASLRESGAAPMGPSLLIALLLTVAFLEALP